MDPIIASLEGKGNGLVILLMEVSQMILVTEDALKGIPSFQKPYRIRFNFGGFPNGEILKAG